MVVVEPDKTYKEHLYNWELWEEVCNLHMDEDDIKYGDLKERIYNNQEYFLFKIELKKINLSDYYVENYKVFEYLEEIKNKGTYPPPVYDLKRNTVIDGMHRLTALYLLNVKEVWLYGSI